MEKAFAESSFHQLQQMPVEYELCVSLHWLSKLRWIAGAGVLVGTWIAQRMFGIGLQPLPLYIIGASILVYNLLFSQWLTQIQCDLTGISARTRNLARVQVSADWLAMTALVHYSGGIESPVILYFFFHTTLSAILLSPGDAYRFTLLAIGLVGATAASEYLGIIPHRGIAGFLRFPLYNNSLYVAGMLFFFSSTALVVVYLATRTTRRLRERETEMVRLGQELQRALDRLGVLYDSAQVVSATLELQEVLDRLTRSTAEAMGVKGCSIRLLHGTSTELCLASTYGLSEAYLQKGCVLVDQNPLAQQALRGEAVVVPDVATDTRLQYAAEAAAEGIRTTLTAPLMGKSGPLGIIRVYCDRAACFTDEDTRFLRAMANQGSIAIENAMAYEAIQNLEEAKRKFVLLVTHELRSPIGVVHSLLKTLAGGYAGDLSRVQADMVERALRRNEFLQTLVDDLLDVAASKAGLRRSTDMQPVDLARVVCRVYERTIITATEKRIALQLDAAEDSVFIVSGNEEELDRAVANLLSNAVKYTPEGGMVKVSLTRQSGNARLAIKDTGIGIPEEAIPHLFEEFYRAPNAREQVKQGTGLGLVIAKEIVTRHNGTIRVSSEVGTGTTFTVILPLLSSGPPAIPVR